MRERLSILVDAQLSENAVSVLKDRLRDDDLSFARVASTFDQTRKMPEEALSGVEIIFGQPDGATVLACATLQWLHVTSAGITRYDTPEFRQTMKARGVIVTNSSSVYDQPCAEHAMSFVLAQARRLPASLQARPNPSSKEWLALRHSYRLLGGQSMVILGYGAIAEKLAGMLAPFDMEIVGWRRNAHGDESVPIITEADLPAALAKADHVMNILPDNASTNGFVSAECFRQMKPGAIFYNIGRGTTVDQDALVEALRSGHLGAAWLDVTEPEPLPEGHALRKLENCFITPHIAGGHFNEFDTIARHFLANLERFREGQPLRDRIV